MEELDLESDVVHRESHLLLPVVQLASELHLLLMHLLANVDLAIVEGNGRLEVLVVESARLLELLLVVPNGLDDIGAVQNVRKNAIPKEVDPAQLFGGVRSDDSTKEEKACERTNERRRESEDRKRNREMKRDKALRERDSVTARMRELVQPKGLSH